MVGWLDGRLSPAASLLRAPYGANKGRHHKEKHVFFRALPELAKPPHPSLQFGQLGHLFPDVKSTFCAYDRKKVPLIIIMVVMIIMIVMMVILMIMMTKNIHISLVLSNNVPTL